MSREPAEREPSIDDRCRCGHGRDKHDTYFFACRRCEDCERFRDITNCDTEEVA